MGITAITEACASKILAKISSGGFPAPHRSDVELDERFIRLEWEKEEVTLDIYELDDERGYQCVFSQPGDTCDFVFHSYRAATGFLYQLLSEGGFAKINEHN